MLESALEWWRDAGVDTLVDDAPHDWFAKPPAYPSPPLTDPVPDDVPPDEWHAFLAWRTGPGSPEAQWFGSAVIASGPATASIMVLADVPDREDCATGALLTGDAGRLFDRMLQAIGWSRDVVHLASVCIKRPAGGRVSRGDQARLGEVARHHIGLVAPERLLLMGDAASRAVLGLSVLEARGRLHPVNHKSRSSKAVATFHPRFLIENPARKREAWMDLQLIRGSGE